MSLKQLIIKKKTNFSYLYKENKQKRKKRKYKKSAKKYTKVKIGMSFWLFFRDLEKFHRFLHWLRFFNNNWFNFDIN